MLHANNNGFMVPNPEIESHNRLWRKSKMASHAGILATARFICEKHVNWGKLLLTSITIRPTGLSSAVMSKKTRSKPIFSAAAANPRAGNAKDDRLGRAVAPKWLKWLKVESIDSRQIDLNAMFECCYTSEIDFKQLNLSLLDSNSACIGFFG